MEARVVVWVALGCATGREPGSTACEPPGTQVESARAAGCATVHDGQLLLVQQTSGRWSIPAGYVEAGEDSAAAAVRETWEEAGVRVRAEEPVCAVPRNRFVAHRCVFLEGSPRADHSETRAARFMTREQVAALKPTELRFPDQQAAYLRFLDEP